jgi:hypothetical protein
MVHKVRTRQKVKAAPEERIAEEKCRHYWIIESPHGPTSRGVCKLCGAEKEFRNSFPETLLWERDRSPSVAPSGEADIEPDRERDDS